MLVLGSVNTRSYCVDGTCRPLPFDSIIIYGPPHLRDFHLRDFLWRMAPNE
jgi:hypothetical protein